MIHWRGLPAWALRAWPVFALLPFFVAHACALHYFFSERSTVNKLAGVSLQVIGGLLVLYSINENLGLFRKQSIFSAFLAWIREFPLVRNAIAPGGVGFSIGSGSTVGIVSARSAPSTLEDRIADLESKLQEFQGQVRKEFNAVQSRIEVAKMELSSRIEINTIKVTELSKQMEMATVGGFKLQAFGVLLAVYGAITSVFA